MSKYILYKFLNSNKEIVYIGQTIRDLKQRHNEHCRENSEFNNFELFFTILNTRTELNLYEAIYISKYKPVLNTVYKNIDLPFASFNDSLCFYKYTEESFLSHKKTISKNEYNIAALIKHTNSFNSKIIVNLPKDLSKFSQRILLTFYIKSKIFEEPIEATFLTPQEFFNFNNMIKKGSNYTLFNNSIDILGERDSNNLYKLTQYSKDLEESSLEELFFLLDIAKTNKYNLYMYYYLKRIENNTIYISDLRAFFGNKYERICDLKRYFINPIFKTLGVSIKEEIRTARIITPLILDIYNLKKF